ncbi:MAG TPA: hypothetical protein VMV69_26150 [Pirellulales bacterium]|nr:hypothetical protein [Pirellulales bacterium]
MSHEVLQLAEQEFILRRIHKNHVDPAPSAVIGFAGFRPTLEDTRGLSVYQEKYASPAEVAAGGRKPGEYYVVRLSVAALRRLGLSVVTDEREQGPLGHALVPELSLSAYQQDRQKLREIQVRLAVLASQDIVLAPASSTTG